MDFNLADVFSAIAARVPDREAIVTPAARLTWADVDRRTQRLANRLTAAGLGCHRERSELAGHEAGQDRVAICMLNGHEFLETMLAALKARCAPCNVNYRYVAAELEELLGDMRPGAVVFQSQFAPQLLAAIDAIGLDPLLIEVPDAERPVGALGATDGGARAVAASAGGEPTVADADTRHGREGGAIEDFEEIIAAGDDTCPDLGRSPDDLYILYTGGTTGRPKGVLWRQGDVFVTALGGRNYKDGAREWESLDELAEAAAARAGNRGLSAAPFMHGTGQWVSFQIFHAGGTVVIPSVVDRYDATDVLDACERESVNLLTIAGEAFAAPLLSAMDSRHRDLSSLEVVSSSGAALSPKSKQALVARLPRIRVRDIVGSSEAGPIADAIDRGTEAGSGAASTFQPGEETCVLDDTRSALLEPGHAGTGWLARGGRIPLGYMNDAEKTAATFRSIGSRRFTVPGDRARILADGSVEVLGRDAVTINSGGEKIFAEEVEAAVRLHPAVRDVIVVGRPSERWGSEVVALVEREPGAAVDEAAVVAACTQAIARYKLPKAVIFVDKVERNPAGKANYAWAKATAAGD